MLLGSPSRLMQTSSLRSLEVAFDLDHAAEALSSRVVLVEFG
jgi:hypothetical protein